jgi:hypothetical protein
LGQYKEAAARAFFYIRLRDGSIDERVYSTYKLFRASLPADKQLSIEQHKEMLREQYLLVNLDEERAVAALPTLLAVNEAKREEAHAILHQVLAASGEMSGESRRRLARVEALWSVTPKGAGKADVAAA